MDLKYIEASYQGINVYVNKLICSEKKTPMMLSVFGNLDLVKAFSAAFISDNKVYINGNSAYRGKSTYRFLQQKVKNSLGHAIIYAEEYFSPYHLKTQFIAYGNTEEEMKQRIWEILSLKCNIPMLESWINYLLPYIDQVNLVSSGFGFNYVSMITLPNDEELYAVIKDNLNELKRIEDKQKL